MRGPLLLALLAAGTAGIAAQIPSELTPETAARLRRQIDSGTTEEKRSALFDIRNLRSAEASAISLPALRDPDVMVRATAASSVIFLPKPDAAAALVPLLTDRDEFVRREAAHALGDVGHRSATAPLVRVLEKDKIMEVRTSAALALGKVGDPTAIESLVRILRKRPTEDDEFLRRSAARSIGQIAQIGLTGDTTVVTPQNFLPEKFKDVGPPGFPSSIDNSRDMAIAVDALISVLRNKSESNDTRREAAYALGWVGDDRAAEALRSVQSSSDPYMAEIASEALIKIERRNKAARSEN